MIICLESTGQMLEFQEPCMQCVCLTDFGFEASTRTKYFWHADTVKQICLTVVSKWQITCSLRRIIHKLTALTVTQLSEWKLWILSMLGAQYLGIFDRDEKIRATCSTNISISYKMCFLSSRKHIYNHTDKSWRLKPCERGAKIYDELEGKCIYPDTSMNTILP